jgi:hypothetical protein
MNAGRQGVPFDTDDAMFNPPVGNPYQEITPVPDVVPHISQVVGLRNLIPGQCLLN